MDAAHVVGDAHCGDYGRGEQVLMHASDAASVGLHSFSWRDNSRDSRDGAEVAVASRQRVQVRGKTGNVR